MTIGFQLNLVNLKKNFFATKKNTTIYAKLSNQAMTICQCVICWSNQLWNLKLCTCHCKIQMRNSSFLPIRPI